MYKNESEVIDSKKETLRQIIDQHRHTPGNLMVVLQEAQKIYGYLPLEVQKIVADGLGVSVAEVYGVITFYSLFSLEPRAENIISVCMGTACYVKGAHHILERIEKTLGIKAGQCTEDRKFSIHACRCIGACGLAPVITINDDVYGRLEADEIPGILAKYKEV